MGKLVRRRPSPSLVISIAALVVALTGTAVAGVATISKLSKSEKTKVRGLADQEIDKKAPGLSVKSAAAASDVTNQMWAVVDTDGGLIRSTAGITGSSRSTTGKYLVSTNRDLSSCYSLASLGGDDEDVGLVGDISTNPISGDTHTVFVRTGTEGAGNSDRQFTILIRC
jgi:hypothetical protein